MNKSSWEKGQGCYNAIAIPILIFCGVASPFLLIFCIIHRDFGNAAQIFSAVVFTIADLVAIIWFINGKVKEYERKKQISEEYHRRDAKSNASSDMGDVKFMKICPRCLWIPHSKCDWVEHKGTEQKECYYCHIPLATANCTEEEFNRSDELKTLVFNYFATRKAYDKNTYEKRLSYDIILKKRKAEKIRREQERQNQARPQNQPGQPQNQPSPQSQPHAQASQIQTPAHPPLPTLTNCPVCGGKVSTAATACPHCGQPLSGGRIASR